MRLRHCLFMLSAAVIAGCATYGADLVPGQSSATDVESLLGQPTAVVEKKDGGSVLWYSKLPAGRESYAAEIDPRGTLVSFDQRLTDLNIARLQPNVSTEQDVMEIVGPPSRRWKYPLKEMEAWEYPLRTSVEPMTLFVDVSPDHVVRNVYKLLDRGRCRIMIAGMCLDQ